MPSIKSVGQVGLGGFLFLAGEKLVTKLCEYGESATPLPDRPARYTPVILSTLPSYPSPASLLPRLDLPQNTTTEITMASATLTAPSSTSPLWTMILSLWSLIQVMVNFFTEYCSEIIADLTVQLLFCVALFYLGHHIDQALIRLLGHPPFPIAHDYHGQEAPIPSFTHFTRATIRELHELADEIQHIMDMEAQRISQLVVQCNFWKTKLTYSEASIDEKMEEAKAIAIKNTEKKTLRKVELAKASAAGEINELKKLLAKKDETEKDLVATNKQSANEIARLKQALAKKKEIEGPASSFNPAAKDFTPSRHPATPSSPSPSNFPPVQKQELTGEARRILEAINEGIHEQNRRRMLGLPAKDEETKPLSVEELDRRTANLSNLGRSSQQPSPAAPAFTPRSTYPLSISPVPSPTSSAPELGRRMRTSDMTGQSPTSSAPELGRRMQTSDMTGQSPTLAAPELGSYPGTSDMTGQSPTLAAPELGSYPGTTDMTGQQPTNIPHSIPTGSRNPFPPPQHHIHHGVKPGTPGTPALTWQAQPAPNVPPGTPTQPRAMRLPKPKTDAQSCFIQPKPRPKPKNNGGNGNGGGSGTRKGPQLPPHLRENAEKKEE